jgi:hypothetical protein
LLRSSRWGRQGCFELGRRIGGYGNDWMSGGTGDDGYDR